MAYSIQPTGLTYFQMKSSWQVPDNISHRMYASWEDALWDLLRIAKVPPQSIVFVPEFFCGDVVQNMRTHGLRPIWYPVDAQMHTDPQVFSKLLQQYQPAVVVIFHAVGITNPLWTHFASWRSALPEKAILLEDSVHRVVDPKNITLLTPRHVVIDSLRKVVPLAGSNVFGAPEFLAFSPTPGWKTLPYQVVVFGWWVVFQAFLLLSRWPFGTVWNRLFNWLAERAMLAGYEVIGDSKLAGRAWWPLSVGVKHIAYERIREAKKQQVRLYQKLLQPFWESAAESIFPIPFSSADAGELRGFPIGLKLRAAEDILRHLREHGILVRFELNDSPWAQQQKIIYLPLGPHLTRQDIQKIASTLLSSKN